MDYTIYKDFIEKVSREVEIPGFDLPLYSKFNRKERSLLWHIEPSYQTEPFRWLLFFMFIYFLWPPIKRRYKRIKQLWSKITKIPIREPRISWYRRNDERRQAVNIFMPYDEHMLYYSLSAGFYTRMRQWGGRDYDKFYPVMRRYSKFAEIPISEDYS